MSRLYTVLMVAVLMLVHGDPSHADVIAHYRFEELSGTTATDSSGNGNDGTYNDVTLGLASATATLGSAGGFNNSTSYVDVPELGTGLTEFSLEAWVNPSSHSTFDTVYNANGWNTGRFHGQFLGSGAFRFALNGATSGLDFGSASDFPLNAWTHLVVTYDSVAQDVTVYANGNSLGTQSSGSSQVVNLLAGRIGAWQFGGTSRQFDGLIDEVSIYNHALTSSEVLANFQSATIPEPSAFLYLAAIGPLWLGWYGRRRHKKSRPAS